MKRNSFLTSLVLSMIILSACNSNEIGESKDVNQERIYFDYYISHNADDGTVNITCQFRFAGMAGTTLVLNDSSKVEFDGEKLKVDSNIVGAFYSINKPLNGFNGKHMISYTNSGGKRFNNEFNFVPFALSGVSEEADRTKDLKVTYQSAPLTKTDYTQVYSRDTDSSFVYSQMGPDNYIVIPAKELMRQKGKTLSLEYRLYQEIKLQQGTSEGGRITIRQQLNPVEIKLLP